MSISNRDPRNPAPKKSTAAAGGRADDAATDEPVGGVLPVKKTTTRAGKTTGNGATTKTTPAKAASAKAGSAKAGSAKGKTTTPLFGGKSAAAAGGGRSGRRPTAPVRVAQSRNWGPIALYVATGLVALAIIGISVWPVVQENLKGTWQERAAAISGLVNYIDPESPSFDATVTGGIHRTGQLTYPMSPPAGGPHNGIWQNCMGDVYTSEIAKEHAVHSLEHGAVWVTYHPDLPQDQIDKLARRVEGREYMLMSPFPGLDAKISLQAWGYQLKVDDADDSRIDDFINALRLNATQEEGAACSGGITEANPTPLDLGEAMPGRG